MMREYHVQFCESLWGKFLRATHLLITTQTLQVAQDLHRDLKLRLATFGIALNVSKTRIMASGKLPAYRAKIKGRKLESFSFLGFIHVWRQGVSRKTGKVFWRTKLFTCPKRYRNKLSQIKEYISRNRHKRGLVEDIVRIVTEYINYFAISGNLERIALFIYEVRRILYKFLKRRSQRGLSPEKFNRMLIYHRFPKARILRNIFGTWSAST